MKMRRIKTLAIEIFKTVNELNSSFMKTIFTSKTNSIVRPFDLIVKNHKDPLANSRNILNRGVVRLASAKCA